MFRGIVLLFAALLGGVFVVDVLWHARESQVFHVAEPRFVTVDKVRVVRVACGEGPCDVLRVSGFVDGVAQKKGRVNYLVGNEHVDVGQLRKVIQPGKRLQEPTIRLEGGHFDVVSVTFGERPFPWRLSAFSLWMLGLWAVLSVLERKGGHAHFPPWWSPSSTTPPTDSTP